MKVQIFDTHVHTDDSYYHFDVVVVDKTQEEVEAYAKAYLKKIGVDFGKISQNRCLFCHEEIADEKMIQAIEAHGHYIIPMQGCPQS